MRQSGNEEENKKEKEKQKENEDENETGQLQMKHMTLTEIGLGPVGLPSELVARDTTQRGVRKSQGEAQDSCHCCCSGELEQNCRARPNASMVPGNCVVFENENVQHVYSLIA